MLTYDYTPGLNGTLIFVHGAGEQRKKWRFLMSSLPKGFAGLALDLPGHGDSDEETPKDIGSFVRAVTDTVNKINSPRPWIWVGHSFGGAIILTIALNHADLVDKLILVGCGARLKVSPAVLETLSTGSYDIKFKKLAFAKTTSPEFVEQEISSDMEFDPVICYNAMFACNQFDIAEHIGTIDKNTLIIVGEDDLYTPVKYSEFLAEKIKSSTLKIIPQAGHAVMLEQPAAMSAVINAFCIS